MFLGVEIAKIKIIIIKGHSQAVKQAKQPSPKLKRQFIKDNKGREIEINMIGEAARNGEKATIVGESKSQLSKNNVDEFIRKKLKRLEGVFPKIFPVLVTYMIKESN